MPKYVETKSLVDLIKKQEEGVCVTVKIDNASNLWIDWGVRGNKKLLNKDWRLRMVTFGTGGQPEVTFGFPREPVGKEVHMLRMYLTSMGVIKRNNERIQRIKDRFMMREEIKE